MNILSELIKMFASPAAKYFLEGCILVFEHENNVCTYFISLSMPSEYSIQFKIVRVVYEIYEVH